MILTAIAAALLVLGVVYLMMGIRSYTKAEMLSGSSHMMMSIVFFGLGVLLIFGSLSLRGYRAFNYEDVAATIQVEPIDKTQFYAHFVYPDGKKFTYKIYGDALYVDAHILKWKPFANLIGIHTSYQLSRVGGRYNTVMDEINKRRSIFPLSDESDLDLFNLRNRFSSLTFLVDAEYGSASFVPAQNETYELRVSNSGLLFRKAEKTD